MRQIELNDFLEPEFRVFVKQRLDQHKLLLTRTMKCLGNIASNNVEIFRKPVEGRVKSVLSIYNNMKKYKKPPSQKKKYFSTLEDLAGVRLTIATKDQFKKAITLVRTGVQRAGLGKFKLKRELGPNSLGYDAVHCIIIDEKRKLNCEVQIRTLTQDLWAVFAHHESYKYEASSYTERELLNFSHLMDVADKYAHAIKEKKIKEAEQWHIAKSKNADKKAISFKEFESIWRKSIIKLKLGEELNFLDLCSSLKQLFLYEIYSKDEVSKLINNHTYKSLIHKSMKKHGLSNLAFHKIFYILCECHHHINVKLEPSPLNDKIENLVRFFKYEEELQNIC